MDSTCVDVGYAWRYLEKRGKQNAGQQPPRATRFTFSIEPEEDGETLLRFMKEVKPHKELIPPLQYAEQQQFKPYRPQNLRLSIESLALEQLPRQQMRQNTSDAVVNANAFSDLDAIAEMGAVVDDHEAQYSGQNTPCSHPPNFPNPNMAINQFIGPYQSRAYDERIHQMPMGMHQAQSQQRMVQMNPIEQQQRFGIYRQQPQHKQMPTSSTYRSMGQTTPQTGAEIFDFDDPSNIGTIGSPSYHSPNGGSRRRGRGRKHVNIGDRQLSVSSLENESTPNSPSDYSASGRKRGSGQRKPRKNKKGSIDLCHPLYPQLQPQPLTGSIPNYTLSLAQSEEVRSRIESQYENYESSTSDEEMDPPPPPRNLQLENMIKEEKPDIQTERSSTSATTHKTSVSSDKQQIKQEPVIRQNEHEQVESKTEIPSSLAAQQISHQHQQPSILRDMKLLVYASSSSSSSSPILTTFQESNEIIQSTESRKNSKQKVNNDSGDQLPKQPTDANKSTSGIIKATSTFNDLYDNQIDPIKKETPDSSTKPKGKRSSEHNSKSKSGKEQTKTNKDKGDGKKHSQTPEETTKKTGKIVLKIKPPREGNVQTLSKTKNSSSSSPSSTSSSLSASAPIHLNEQSVTRLSSSGAPPSKSKQQSIQQHQQRGSIKRQLDAPDDGAEKKKSRKTDGRASPNQRIHSSSIAITKTSKQSKDAKNGVTQLQKELPPPFIPQFGLKNFKIPKVNETSESLMPQCNTSAPTHSKNPVDQQIHQSLEKERKPSSSYEPRGSHNPSDYRRHADKGSFPKSSSDKIPYGQYSGRPQLKPDKRGPTSETIRNKKYNSHGNFDSKIASGGGGRQQLGPSRIAQYQQSSPRELQSSFQQNWPQFGQQSQFPSNHPLPIIHGNQRSNWMPIQTPTPRSPTQIITEKNEHRHQQQFLQQNNPTEESPTNQGKPLAELVEDRNDNSPSEDALQIVDEE